VSVKAEIHHKDTKSTKKGEEVEHRGHRGHREEGEIQGRNAGVQDSEAGFQGRRAVVVIGLQSHHNPCLSLCSLRLCGESLSWLRVLRVLRGETAFAR
jgi:hypothetical protein